MFRTKPIVVALLAVAATVGACTLAGPVTKGKWTGPGGSGVEFESPAPQQTWKVNAPPDRCWTLKFYDANGNEVGSYDGQGTDAGFTPTGASRWVIDDRDCDQEEGGVPIGASDFLFEKAPMQFTLGEVFRATRIRVDALSEANAAAKAASVEQGGPGTALPSNTYVQAFIDVASDGTDIVVQSSLPLRFRDFTITVNGVVLADKASGLNVTATTPGNGWVTLTSVLPASAAANGNEVVVTQDASGFDQPVVATVGF
ncbi:MAG TPA: hypothetical protein VFY71_16815 [Planctomycetota bacterium]|nr:hypothetical protein [Planctomycetota bacterium]